MIAFFEIIFGDRKVREWFCFERLKLARFDLMEDKFFFDNIFFLFLNRFLEIFIHLRVSPVVYL